MPQQPRYPSRRTLAPQGAPAGLYASTYSVERGAAICQRVAAGESLRAICRADAAMPTGKTLWNWRRAHGDFATMLDHAQGVARTRSLRAQQSADDARAEARAQARKSAGRTGRPSSFDVATWDEIRARIMGGEALTEICTEPWMPCAGTVYGWMRRRPELVAEYQRARSYTLDGMLERACAGLPWLGERKSWPMLRRTVRATETLAARRKLRRYAARTGKSGLCVAVVAADGSEQVIYQAWTE